MSDRLSYLLDDIESAGSAGRFRSFICAASEIHYGKKVVDAVNWISDQLLCCGVGVHASIGGKFISVSFHWEAAAAMLLPDIELADTCCRAILRSKLEAELPEWAKLVGETIFAKILPTTAEKVYTQVLSYMIFVRDDGV